MDEDNSNLGDYLCEEIMDDVRRGNLKIYQAILSLRDVYTTGYISQGQMLECRKTLHVMVNQRMEKDNDLVVMGIIPIVIKALYHPDYHLTYLCVADRYQAVVR